MPFLELKIRSTKGLSTHQKNKLQSKKNIYI